MSKADDIEDIRQATHRYCLALDGRDVEGCVGVFTPDAHLDHTPLGFAVCTGHDEMRTYFTQLHEQLPAMAHLLTNHVIEFDGPDAAHGVNYVYAEATPATGDPIRTLAKNTDHYVRTADGWKIDRRTTTGLL